MPEETVTPTPAAVPAAPAVDATRLNEAVVKMGQLAEENQSLQRQLREMRLDAKLTQLSDNKPVVVTDPESKAQATFPAFGIPAAVIDYVRERVMENGALEEPLLKTLQMVREAGAIQFGELGAGRLSEAHDPEMPAVVAGGDAEFEKKWMASAEQYAMTTYQKRLMDLDHNQRAGVFALTEPKRK